jgi:hypothetical protein
MPINASFVMIAAAQKDTRHPDASQQIMESSFVG